VGKITVSLGNPLLILIWSLAMLLLGCVIGMHWKATPGTAFCVAAVGAILMVLHDLGMGLLWFVASAKLLDNARHDRS
jgi:multisubunit Na+/H+ antiporter MnhB subunit